MPTDDPELLAALEAELGVTKPPETPPPPEPALKGDEEPPEGEEGEEGAKKGEVDLLEALTKDPKALQKLLAHPKLGPTLNRWADTAAQAQVRAAVEAAKGTTEAETRQRLQEEREDRFFEELDPEELAEELKDSNTAAAYGRYQLRKQQPKRAPGSEEELNRAAQVYATISLLQTYRSMVDDSGLSDEVKAELQPEKFAHLGDGALVAWGKAIYDALVDFGVEQRWESEKESRLADLDKSRPDLGAGRPPGRMPDLMTTDSRVGLEQALAAEAQKRK